MQVLHLSHLGVFDRLLAHFLILGVLQRFVRLLINDFELTRDFHQVANALLRVLHLARLK